MVSVPLEREPSTRLLIGLLLVAALVPRLGVFPVNENRFGDAVARTELAERWLQQPLKIGHRFEVPKDQRSYLYCLPGHSSMRFAIALSERPSRGCNRLRLCLA